METKLKSISSRKQLKQVPKFTFVYKVISLQTKRTFIINLIEKNISFLLLRNLSS